MKDQVEEYREAMIELAVEQDEAVLEKYLEGEELTDRRDQSPASARAPANWPSSPPTAAPPLRTKGFRIVLDAVVDYLPNPTEVPPQPEIDLEGTPPVGMPTSIPRSPAGAGLQDHG
jgi:elongation factor G